MSYEPLHHKYRPQTFADLVGQEAIATTLSNAIGQEKIAPAYLFSGPRGTGKTSSARILAKSLNCLSSGVPTATPCGNCDVCQGITKGSTLDVIEIDAASNTGVDNIRELIERAQFAPVQCRHKVYIIDECLTGDSLVLTDEGLIRIDRPEIKGKKVLSYNESTNCWEFKQVLRWLDRGEKQTIIIRTNNQTIRCTGNHLIRTERGWIPAKNVREGMRILSPVNVVVANSFTNMEQMDLSEDLREDISFTVINTAKNHTSLPLSSKKQKFFVPSVLADVEKNWMYLSFYKQKAKELVASSLTGQSIHIKNRTEFGTLAQQNISPMPLSCNQKIWDLSTVHYWEMALSPTQTNTADSPDYLGHMVFSSENGWSTKLADFQNCNQRLKSPLTEDTEIYPFAPLPSVTLNLKMSLISLSKMGIKNLSPSIGLIELLQKELHGGTWMMGRLASAPREAHQFNFTQKDILTKKIKLSPIGFQKSDIQLKQNPIEIALQEKHTAVSVWTQTQLGNGLQISNSIQSSQWITNLETVKSVKVAGIEKVYDIEVEDNHNFIANGLLVHNCHMLSAAAFNALLKTLEEPPDQVVFVLATTDPQRVLATIISRCQRFDFRRIPLNSMVKHLRHIANKENININDEAITLVAQIAQGGLRDAESTLDQLSLSPDMVTVEKVWDLVGAVPEQDLMSLLSAIAKDDPIAVLEIARHLMDRGREPLIVIQNLASFYRDLLIAKTAPNRADLVAVTSSTWENLCQFNSLTISEILAGQKNLKESEYQLKNTTQPRLWLEVTLIGLLPISIANQPVKQNGLPPRTLPVQPTEINRDRYNNQPGSSPPPNPTHESQLKDNSHPPSAQPERVETTPPNSPILNTNNPVTSENEQPNKQQVYDNYSTPDRELANFESHVYSDRPEEISPQQLDLDEIWRKVLPYIQPKSIQQLLSQLCHLEYFTDRTATISVLTDPSSQKSWVDNLQKRLPNIEAAFQAALNLQIKVTLIRASSTTARNGRASKGETRTNSPKFNNSANNKKEALPAPPSTAIAPSPPKFESEKEVYVAVPTNRSEIKPSSPPADSPALDRAEKPNQQDIQKTAIQDDEEIVAKAAQRLVSIFKGKIIPISDDLKISLFATKEQKTESNNTQLNFKDLPEDELENENEDF